MFFKTFPPDIVELEAADRNLYINFCFRYVGDIPAIIRRLSVNMTL